MNRKAKKTMSQGTVKAVVYISQMTIPIEGASVYIYRDTDGKSELISLRKTNQNGETGLVEITTPDKAESLSPLPDGSDNPFASVNIFVEAEGYRSVLIHSAQVFPENLTVQNVEMVPLAEPAIREGDRVIDVFVTPQPLNLNGREI